MSGFDWKGTVGTLAPTLAGIFGSPVAGVAVGALCKAFGLEPSAENAQAVAEKAAAGTLTGAELIQLKKAESDAKAEIMKLGFDYDLAKDQLVMSDLDSARKREMAVRDWTPRILAYGVTAGFFGLLAYMLRHDVPAANKDMLNILLGALGSAWIGVVNYYFGSSQGSDRKTELLHQSTPVDGK